MARNKKLTEFPAILMAIPTLPVQPRVYRETLAAVEALEWPGRLDVMQLRRDGLHADPNADLAAKLEQARRLAIAGDYESLLIVEADMLPPSDTIYRLMDMDADIAYGLYCSRRQGHPWLLASTLNAEDATRLDAAGMAAAWGNVMPSAGVGTGCTLLNRKALRKLAFRHVAGSYSPDWWLALDAQDAGLSQAHDCGLLVGHIIQHAPLAAVWPAQDGHRLVVEAAHIYELSPERLYEVAQRLTFMRDGQEPAYHGPGDVIVIEDRLAQPLLAAHKIRAVQATEGRG